MILPRARRFLSLATATFSAKLLFLIYVQFVIDNRFLKENNREDLSSYIAIVFHKSSRILCVSWNDYDMQILLGNEIFRKRGH